MLSSTRRLRPALIGLCAIACCAGPAAGLIWPQLNWDMLAYLGITLSWRLRDPATVQHAAYADMLRYAHAIHNDAAGQALVAGNPYRLLMSSDPAAFAESFGFYRIRPLYEALLACVGRLTPTLAKATVLISAASVLAANGLMLGFAARRRPSVPALLAALFFTLSPAQMLVAGYSTADALGTATTLAGVLLFLTDRPLWGAVVLAASVGIRTDFMVVNAMLAVVFGVEAISMPGRGALPRRPAWLGACAILAASVIAAKAIEHWAGSYGYRVLWYNTFVTILPHPAHPGTLAIPPHRWITAILSGVVTGLQNGAFALPLLSVLGIGALWRPGDRHHPAGLVAIAFTLGLAARVVLFPSPDVRLTAPVFAALWAVLVAFLAEGRLTLPGARGENPGWVTASAAKSGAFQTKVC